LSPKQYANEIGPLFSVRRPGKPPMLAARVTVGSASSSARIVGHFARERTVRRLTGQKFQTIPLFVGVPHVDIPKKFDASGAIKLAFNDLDKFYQKRFLKYDGKTVSYL
jgi:hypothetical protein